MTHYRRVRGQVPWRKRLKSLGMSAGLEVAIEVVRDMPKPNDPDTDGDGLWDGDEYFGDVGMNYDGISNPHHYITDPLSVDTDGDGLTDKIEVVHGINPINIDTDGDGLPDGWIDFNNNGQKDLGEFEDKDLDGVVDTGRWCKWGDRYTDLDEYGKGPGETDPKKKDTDNDGLSDMEEERGWKCMHFLSISNISCIHHAHPHP